MDEELAEAKRVADELLRLSFERLQAGVEVIEGGKDAPTFTLKMDADEYLKMAHGKLNGAMAFMTGKMKISGDRGLANTMKKIFPLIK